MDADDLAKLEAGMLNHAWKPATLERAFITNRDGMKAMGFNDEEIDRMLLDGRLRTIELPG